MFFSSGEKDQIKGETIDYNENFSWEGLQGRFGFGPFGKHLLKVYIIILLNYFHYKLKRLEFESL